MIWLLTLMIACEGDECEGSMLAGPGGLLVTQVEHPTGWGEADCAQCHVPAVLHRQECTPEVDLVEVRALVDEGGVGSCVTCHGDNGVDE